jgi:hypothetical protein
MRRGVSGPGFAAEPFPLRRCGFGGVSVAPLAGGDAALDGVNVVAASRPGGFPADLAHPFSSTVVYSHPDGEVEERLVAAATSKES